MRYELRPYQSGAVEAVLSNLTKAGRRFHDDGECSAFALSAVTGAGKTVIAAAVIESLFFGNEDFAVPADPGAVVLWFSDSVDLNAQSKTRIRAAASELDSRMRTVETDFAMPKFEPQTVYFLNTQKLAKTGRLVRGHDTAADADGALFAARPDDAQTTIWDTIAATVADENLTLYLILDEAHRGIGRTANADDRSTIVQRLIHGHGDVPPMPVVWGISATVERFDRAMGDASNYRTHMPSVQVDPDEVQESGLLKDDIVLDTKDEEGSYDSALLRQAVRNLLDSTQAWADYAAQQRDHEPVVPLMVVQIPNTLINDEDADGDQSQSQARAAKLSKYVGDAIATILEEWPEMPHDAVAHVFGEPKGVLQTAVLDVPDVEPELVQDRPHIRVLFAKDAISTGWDCPRAEVLVSFRPYTDRTAITQILGRMVRTPLKRRIEGNDALNAVSVTLPRFDRKTVIEVAEALRSGSTQSRTAGLEDGSAGGDGRRVLLDPERMVPRTEGLDDVWSKFDSLPSHTVPRTGARPVKRLTALAQALADDAIKADAGAAAHAHLHAVLDGRAVQHADAVSEAAEDVRTIDLVRTTVGRSGSVDRTSFSVAADDAAIRDAYRAAARVLTADVARTYVDHLAGGDADDEALREAMVKVAALARVPQVAQDIETEAKELSDRWLDEHRVDILSLTHARKGVYNALRAMSAEPERGTLERPEVWLVETSARAADGSEQPLPTRPQHLMVGPDGQSFPVDLSAAELRIVDKESARAGFAAWYRNPARSNPSALTVAYRDGDRWRAIHPDFLFFSRVGDTVHASIVDPHGHHLADAVAKLVGLAAFAEAFGDEFLRIEAVAEVDGSDRVLDLQSPAVRSAVRAAVAAGTSAKDLYASGVAAQY